MYSTCGPLRTGLSPHPPGMPPRKLRDPVENKTFGEISAVKLLRPDDVRAGMFVTVLYETHEVFPPPVFEVGPEQSVRPFRVPCLGCADGEPRLVLTVCLPFVQTETPSGELATLDIRRHTLVTVSEDFGLEAFTRPSRQSRGDDIS